MAQPSSGTTLFQPSFADMVIEAYSRCQIRPTSLTAQHMRDGYMSGNFLQSEWVTREGPNLWRVKLFSQALTQGTASYSVDPSVVDILDYYLNSPTGSATATDIVVSPISRTEYADQPQKTLQARPTTVWWDRTITSTITLWPVPDGNGPYTLYFYGETQIEDNLVSNGTTVGIPYRFYDAFAAGLAAKLSVKYSPPATAQGLMVLAEKAWQMASDRDIENVPLFIVPALSFYNR